MKILSPPISVGILAMNVRNLVQPTLAWNTGVVDRSRMIFSSSFHQPEPPMVESEFRANWNQHKWYEPLMKNSFVFGALLKNRLHRDANISNIASGFIYHSPSQETVRVDETYESTLGSSLFDYTNVTQEGVANRVWTLSPAITSPPQCFEGFVSPAFPLITEDILVANNAIYGGLMHDALAGEVALVSLKAFCSCLRYELLISLADPSSCSGISYIRELSQ